MSLAAVIGWICILTNYFSTVASVRHHLPRHGLHFVEIADYPSSYPGKIRAIAKIYNVQRMNRQGWTEECYGAFLDFRLVVTACSCVSYIDDPRMEITPWIHGNFSEVLPVMEANLKVGMMFYEFHPYKKEVGVQTVLLHPKCDNYYHVDYAILILKKRHPRAEPIQLNIAGNADIVREKLKTLSATSAIDDSCTIIYWSERGPYWRLRQNVIKFQPWNQCFEHVCPIFKPPLTPKGPQQQNMSECLNKVGSGSRHCVQWTANPALCQMRPGTPLFCNFGNSNGVWGLMVNGRYSCPPWGGARGILNGVDGAIDWIRSIYEAHKNDSSQTTTSEPPPRKRMNCQTDEVF